MRSLGLLALVLVPLAGCGPAVGDSPEEGDDEWMLGTFSLSGTLCGETCMGEAQRFEIEEGGGGRVVGVGCEEWSEPLSWVLQDDGAVKIEFFQETHPTAIVFSGPVCDEEGLVSHLGQRFFRVSPESTSDAVFDVTLYRSVPCPGEYIPGDDCEDNGNNECDSRGGCTVVWCEGGEPERCEEGA